MKRFENRVAFVTGAAHGIGRATVLRLAAEGAAVGAADIDAEATASVVAEIAEAGGSALALSCDITDTASVAAAVAATVKRFGRLDVLANVAGHNVGGLEGGEPAEEQWSRQYDFTFTGAVRCIRASLPHLLASRGAVVLVGSISAEVALGTAPYAAAAIAFLASDDAAWITGITLPVEGGLTTGPGHLLNKIG